MRHLNHGRCGHWDLNKMFIYHDCGTGMACFYHFLFTRAFPYICFRQYTTDFKNTAAHGEKLLVWTVNFLAHLQDRLVHAFFNSCEGLNLIYGGKTAPRKTISKIKRMYPLSWSLEFLPRLSILPKILPNTRHLDLIQLSFQVTLFAALSLLTERLLGWVWRNTKQFDSS